MVDIYNLREKNRFIGETIMGKIRIQDKLSVRTTFKLSGQTIDGLKELANEYGITFKEVFEIICFNNLEPVIEDFSDNSVKNMKQNDQNELSIRKTFVISKYTLKLLNRFSTKYKLSRNAIIEFLLSSYQADRSLKKEQLRKKHENALKRINKLIALIEKELKGLDVILDDSDEDDAPIFDILNDVVLEMILYLRDQIKKELTNGTSIDMPVSIINSMSAIYERV